LEKRPFLFTLILNSVIIFSLISIVGTTSNTSVTMAAESSDPATKVLVIDWMSDPLLSYLNTLANESLDTSLGLWVAGDLNPLSGLDYWGVSSQRFYAGSGSAYSSEVGETGYMSTHMVINEILYDPIVETSRPQREWFEIYNPTPLPIDVYGYVIEDNNHRMKIDSHVVVSSGEYVVISNNVTAFREDYPGFNGKIIEEVNNAASETDDPHDDGNAVPVWYDTYDYEDLYLNNGGDWLKLFWLDPGPLDMSGSTFLVDAAAWESMPPTNIYDPPKSSEVGTWNVEDASDGYSIQRSPNAKDTNNCNNDFYAYPNGNLLGITTPGLTNTRNYDDNMDSFLQTSISLLGRTSATMSYYYWIESELNYDWLAVQVSADIGPWVTLANYTGDSDGWKYETKSLDPFVGKLTVQIRFLFHSNDANHDFEGAYVDEVKVVASPFPFMDNSIEKAFWSRIDTDPNVNVFVRPPAIVDIAASILAGRPVTTKSIINYLQEIQPDVIVLDDLCQDMFDIWGLNKTERLAVFDYIEQGHGLIMTYGSLFDMRLNTTYVGPYGHVNRLYLEQNPSFQDLKDNYRSSLAAASGLGLLPIYEEAREQIANFIEDPELAFVVRSAPLLPMGVPFNGTFAAQNASDPLLEGLGSNFKLSLESKGVYANGTLVGWQLEYPFLMASRAINRTKELMDQIKPVIEDVLYQTVLSVSSNISDLINYDFPSLAVSDAQLDAIVGNATETMTKFLMSLYEARLKTPTEITIPIRFTIGGIAVDKNITIPIPVEVQEVVKPAAIVAESADGLAAILRYEVGNHRAVYFTFKPSLGSFPGGPSEQLVKNAIKWASEPPTTKPLTTISNMGIPSELVNAVRSQLGLPQTTTSEWNRSDVINEKRAYEYSLTLSKADSVAIYWYGDPAKITLTLGGITYTATNITTPEARGALIWQVPTGGTWTLSIKLKGDDPLLTPLAIETYGGDLISPTSLNDYDGLWHITDFTIILTATDDTSGVAATYYRINNGQAKTVSADGQPFITAENANNTLEYWSVDNADNEELPHKILTEIKLDKTKPTGSVTINNNATYTASTSVTLTLTATDATSGVYQVRFSNDGVWDTEAWETPSSTKTWTLSSGDGTKTVYYQIKDIAGLTSQSYSDMVIMDVTPPTIIITSPSPGYEIRSSTITVTWTGSDETSEISHYEIRLDGSSWTNIGTNTTHTFSEVGDGSHTIDIKATDKAGNVKQDTVSFQVNTSPLLGPGYTEEVAVSIAIILTALAIAIYYIKIRKR